MRQLKEWEPDLGYLVIALSIGTTALWLFAAAASSGSTDVVGAWAPHGLALSGVIVAVLLFLHPSILVRPVAEVVEETDVWEPLHVAFALMFVFAAIGAAGLVAAHGNRLGRLGQVGLVLTVVGAIGGFGIGIVEAMAFPVLAERLPEVLALQGPLLTSWVFIGLGLLWLAWAIGLTLIGIAAARAAVFPRAAGVLLAIGAVAFHALGAPFVPVAGILSGLLFGAAQIWWAWLLWRHTAKVKSWARNFGRPSSLPGLCYSRNAKNGSLSCQWRPLEDHS